MDGLDQDVDKLEAYLDTLVRDGEEFLTFATILHASSTLVRQAAVVQSWVVKTLERELQRTGAYRYAWSF